ncbi:MAG: 3-oxoacyl-ACP reductase FabG [Candidatus Cloacimonadota bacterium]|nr:MAG: 3-oxoacyl-ACP reductase FabG [Candidatus Cloacimonadota bacterium]
MARLKNKIAIITGSARGIGFATAKRFLEEGANVALWDIQEDLLKKAKAALNLDDSRVKTYVVDVCNQSSVENAYQAVENDFGSVDIMVNNAGITKDAMLHKMNEEQFDQVINVNLKGVYLCGQAAAKRMRENGSGVILNTSSVVGIYGNIGQTNYAASKWGVIGMTKTWAKELGAKGIRVNAVAPGYTMTEMMETVPKNVLDTLKAMTPLKNLGQPEDIANAFLFLASNEAKFITGHVLSVDGGLTI